MPRNSHAIGEKALCAGRPCSTRGLGVDSRVGSRKMRSRPSASSSRSLGDPASRRITSRAFRSATMRERSLRPSDNLTGCPDRILIHVFQLIPRRVITSSWEPTSWPSPPTSRGLTTHIFNFRFSGIFRAPPQTSVRLVPWYSPGRQWTLRLRETLPLWFRQVPQPAREHQLQESCQRCRNRGLFGGARAMDIVSWRLPGCHHCHSVTK